MYFKKFAAIFVLMVLVIFALAGCGEGGVSQGNGQHTTKGAKEPALKSANASTIWPGLNFVVVLDYEKVVDENQIKIMIGELEAEIVDGYNNQFRINAPLGIKAGTHSITAAINGKECKNPLSIEVASPVITKVETYAGKNIGIETGNIKENSAQIRVYINGAELPYQRLTDMGASGKFRIITEELPEGTTSGEVYITYGENRSNTMSFVFD